MPASEDQVAAARASEQTRPKNIARLLTRREVLDKIPVTYVTLVKWMEAGTFPHPRQAGGRAMWLEAEVDTWIASLARASIRANTSAETI